MTGKKDRQYMRYIKKETSFFEVAWSEAAKDFAKEMGYVPESKNIRALRNVIGNIKLWYLLNKKNDRRNL
jgi:hypothetical protein